MSGTLRRSWWRTAEGDGHGDEPGMRVFRALCLQEPVRSHGRPEADDWSLGRSHVDGLDARIEHDRDLAFATLKPIGPEQIG